MAYRIVFTRNAIDDLHALHSRVRTAIRDAVGIHLTHEPLKESRSRIKRLRGMNHPQCRLGVEEVRVFYDVSDTDVVILAIMPKEKTIQWLQEHGEK